MSCPTENEYHEMALSWLVGRPMSAMMMWLSGVLYFTVPEGDFLSGVQERSKETFCFLQTF